MVDARDDKGDNKFGDSISRKMFSDLANRSEMRIAWLSSMGYTLMHRVSRVHTQLLAASEVEVVILSSWKERKR